MWSPSARYKLTVVNQVDASKSKSESEHAALVAVCILYSGACLTMRACLTMSHRSRVGRVCPIGGICKRTE
jgi:hypothetical protein